MKSKIHSTMLTMSLALLLGACSPNEEVQGNAQGQSQQGEVVEQETQSVEPVASAGEVVASADPSTLKIVDSASEFEITFDPAIAYDVWSGGYLENVYETLVGYEGGSSDLSGILAEEWNLSEDGKSVSFKLRPDVKFHSGNSMTCADAEYTFRRNMVTNHPNSSHWFIAQALFGNGANANDNPDLTWKAITSAIKCEGETLVFTMPKYDPSFVPKLGYIGQAIIDKKHAIAIGEWDGTEATWKDWVGKDSWGSALDMKPSGTGPYRLAERTATSMTFKAFDAYWDEAPAIQKVVATTTDDAEQRKAAFLSGEADFAYGVSTSEVRDQPGIAVLSGLPNSSIALLGLNQNIGDPQWLGSGKLDGSGVPAAFFADESVRRGFAQAFDMDKYIQEYYGGEAYKKTFSIPEGFAGYTSDIASLSYNPEQAAEEFKKAFGGQLWEKGFVLKLPYYDDYDEPVLYQTMLRDELAAINPKFKLELVPYDSDVMFGEMLEGKHPIIDGSWYPDYADADNMVYPLLHSGGYYSKPTNISDPYLDTLTSEANSALIEAQRKEQYERVAEYANEKAFYIWLPSGTSTYKFRNSLEGFTPENYNILRNGGVFWKDLSKQ